MSATRWINSIVTRLTVAFCLGGLLLSIGLGILRYRHNAHYHRDAASRQLLVQLDNLQAALRPLIDDRDGPGIDHTLHIIARDRRLLGARLSTDDEALRATAGPWRFDEAPAEWRVSPDRNDSDPPHELSTRRLTRMTTAFHHNGEPYMAELLVDGPYLGRLVRSETLSYLLNVWLLLGLLTLMGILLLRRWLALPLHRIMTLTRHNASAVAFEKAARPRQDELHELAYSIGSMLRRLNDTSRRLRQREQALAHLYDFAPAALVTIDREGRIQQANRRAAELFAWRGPNSAVGCEILQWIVAQDRGRLRQALHRVASHGDQHFELLIHDGTDEKSVAVEMTAVCEGENAQPNAFRLGFLDITALKSLMYRVCEQRSLLELIVNHMTEAILLVDRDGRVIAANERLAQMLHVPVDSLRGQLFDDADFWAPLELRDHESFNRQLLAVARQGLTEPVRQPFDGVNQSYLFKVTPVSDSAGGVLGHLWVVQEASARVRDRRRIEQQVTQLATVERLAAALARAADVPTVMQLTLEHLKQVLPADVAGIALRTQGPDRRCAQLLSHGDHTPYPAGRDIAAAIAQQVMPRVLRCRATSFWADLSLHQEWSGRLVYAGFESLAATPLAQHDRNEGMIWFGHRSGDSIERHHLALLEAVAPVIALALARADLRQRLGRWETLDDLTGLPSREALPAMVARRLAEPGRVWALLLLRIDNLATLRARLTDRSTEDVIRRVATILRDTVRPDDQVVRLDDEHFVLLCHHTETHNAHRLADRIRAVLATEIVEPDLPGNTPESPLSLRPSMGVVGPENHADLERMLDLARSRLAQDAQQPSLFPVA